MISTFGIISFIVVLVCVNALVLHFKVMKRRTSVDENFVVLDNLLREQLEILYASAEAVSEAASVREMCEALAERDTHKLFRALPNLKKEADIFFHTEELSEISSETEQAVANYNAATETYNEFIEKFPASAMASILALPIAKPVLPHLKLKNFK